MGCTMVVLGCTMVVLGCSMVVLGCTMVVLGCTLVVLGCTVVVLDATPFQKFSLKSHNINTRKRGRVRFLLGMGKNCKKNGRKKIGRET